MSKPTHVFPAPQEAFLRALKGGGYQGVARAACGHRSVSLVNRMPPVYQQALQDTCVPNAVTALLEYYYGPRRPPLSVQFLFAATKEVERNALELNFVNLRKGQPLDVGFESFYHRELNQLRMLAAANGGMAASAVQPYLAQFEAGVRERFAAAPGCLLVSCFQALEEYGVCRRDLWPQARVQTPSLFGSRASGRIAFPPGTREEARKRRITYGLYRLGTPNNVDEIRNILAGENRRRPMPVVVTVDFFGGCDGETYAFPETEVNAEGHLVSVNAYEGRHALLIVGYVDNSSYAGGGYFLIRNSFGEAWGNRGYGKLPYAYLECFALEAGTIQQDLVDWEGDGGLLGPAGGGDAVPRRRKILWGVNATVALALVAGTIAVGAYFDDPLGLRRKPVPQPVPPPPPPVSEPAAPAAPPPAETPPVASEKVAAMQKLFTYKVLFSCGNDEVRRALRTTFASEGVPFGVEFPVPKSVQKRGKDEKKALVVYVKMPEGNPYKALEEVLKDYYAGPGREFWTDTATLVYSRALYIQDPIAESKIDKEEEN